MNVAADKAPWVEFDIYESNHHEHFDRWLSNPEHMKDKENIEIFLETALALVRAAKANAHLTAFRYWAAKLLKRPERFHFYGRNESVQFNKIEHGQHGDKGPNGARGSLKAYAQIGAKGTYAHSHTAGIIDGAYQVGTSSQLYMGYNAGFSSWCHVHCIQYKNGKRTLVQTIDGQWRIES
jgi:hypothetical protein